MSAWFAIDWRHSLIHPSPIPICPFHPIFQSHSVKLHPIHTSTTPYYWSIELRMKGQITQFLSNCYLKAKKQSQRIRWTLQSKKINKKSRSNKNMRFIVYIQKKKLIIVVRSGFRGGGGGGSLLFLRDSTPCRHKGSSLCTILRCPFLADWPSICSKCAFGANIH